MKCLGWGADSGQLIGSDLECKHHQLMGGMGTDRQPACVYITEYDRDQSKCFWDYFFEGSVVKSWGNPARLNVNLFAQQIWIFPREDMQVCDLEVFHRTAPLQFHVRLRKLGLLSLVTGTENANFTRLLKRMWKFLPFENRMGSDKKAWDCCTEC